MGMFDDNKTLEEKLDASMDSSLVDEENENLDTLDDESDETDTEESNDDLDEDESNLDDEEDENKEDEESNSSEDLEEEKTDEKKIEKSKKKEKEPKAKKPKISHYKKVKIPLSIFEAIVIGVLVTIGVFLIVKEDSAIELIFFLTGGLAISLVVFRLFMLIVKLGKLNKTCIRIILVECLLVLVVSGFMILAGVSKMQIADGDSSSFKVSFVEHMARYYANYTASVCYIMCVSFFIRNHFYKDNKSNISLWFNIGIMTIGFLLCAYNDKLQANELPTTIAVLLFTVSGVILLDLLVALGLGIRRKNKSKPKKEKKPKEKKSKDDEEE